MTIKAYNKKFLGIEPNIRIIETTGGLEEVGKWSSNMSL